MMKAPQRPRLDQLLFERGLAESREKARALILSGAVLINGQRVDKAGARVPADAAVELTGRHKYVSRGGLKLEAALDAFGIRPEGRICLDIGASTGGFTDCLLQRGAARVYAVDTGAGQLHWRLRTDPRVYLLENTNARYLKPEQIGEPISLAVCDVSFISATLILPVLPPLLQSEAEIVVLVKPQFEAGRHQVGKGGIVRDPAVHQQAVRRVEACCQQLGFHTQTMECPLPGAEGNREFLLYGRLQASP